MADPTRGPPIRAIASPLASIAGLRLWAATVSLPAALLVESLRRPRLPSGAFPSLVPQRSSMQALAAAPVMLAPAVAQRQAAAAAAARPAAAPRPQPRRRCARAAARRVVAAAAEGGAQQLQAFATTEPRRVMGADGKLAQVRWWCGGIGRHGGSVHPWLAGLHPACRLLELGLAPTLHHPASCTIHHLLRPPPLPLARLH